MMQILGIINRSTIIIGSPAMNCQSSEIAKLSSKMFVERNVGEDKLTAQSPNILPITRSSWYEDRKLC